MFFINEKLYREHLLKGAEESRGVTDFFKVPKVGGGGDQEIFLKY
jgi:hypothetical protein